MIEAALAHATGRPRPLPVRAVLTALLCLALDDRPLFLTEATGLLFCELSGASAALLGVPGSAASHRAFLAAYRRVRYCFHRICSVVDPSPLPKNRRLAPGDLRARIKKMLPGQAEAARNRLEALINALIEASVSVLDEEEQAASDGSAGLDATPVPLFSAARPAAPGCAPVTPTAAGTSARATTATARTTRESRCARSAGRWRRPSPPPPPARRAARLPEPRRRPGTGPARRRPRRHRRPRVASVAARGHKTGWLGYDRAYTQALPGRFHLPARALGYKPVMDYRADQLGIQANSQGALLVEGTGTAPPCPAR